MTWVFGNFSETVVEYRDQLEKTIDEKNTRPPTAEDHAHRRRGIVDPSTDISGFKLVLKLEPLQVGSPSYEFELLDCKLEWQRVKSGIYLQSITHTDADYRPWVEEVMNALPVRIEGERADLSALKPLSDEEVGTHLNPPPAPPPAPEPPPLVRTQRQPGDSSNRLGLTVGLCNIDLKLSPNWCWHAFHIPSVTIVGRISVAMETNLPNSALRVRLYNASGDLLLQTKLTGSRGQRPVEFDDVQYRKDVAERVGVGFDGSNPSQHKSCADNGSVEPS